MKTKNRILAALLTLAMVLTMLPVSAFAEGESQKAGETQIVEHNPREHKGCSVIHQAYGPNSVYLKCTWEEDASGAHQQCEFHDWVLIRIPTISAYYNGQPWTPSFHWQTMRNYPYCEFHDGLPLGVSVVTPFTYEGINGMAYGPSIEPPIGAGEYKFYTVIHIPHTADSLAGTGGDFRLESELHIRESDFTLSFDANYPDSASTKEQGSGTMKALRVPSVIEERQLPANRFKLPGYEFKGWNTRPDGKGTWYADEEFVKGENGISKYGEDVTLYAQWDPLEYTITFNYAGPEMPELTQTATFDQPGKLMDVTGADVDGRWELPENSKLQGWSVSGSELFYEDQAPFCNLCDVQDDGSVDGLGLYANFGNKGQIIAAVTKDGVPQNVWGSLIELTDRNGTDFLVPSVYTGGRYTLDPTGAISPAGTPCSLEDGMVYTLSLGRDDLPTVTAEILYKSDSVAHATLDYYTVSARPAAGDKGKGIADVAVDGKQELVVFEGSTVDIRASTETGYHFDGYNVVGVEPIWGDSAPTAADQSITVNGTATLIARSAPNTYTVHFDANSTKPVIGEMEDVVATYDQSQDLPANQFVIAGGTFLGWNTRADGTGVSYADEAEILNLTSEDGAQVTLYAQWKFNEYKINVTNDGNGSAEANPKSGHIGTQVTLTAFPNTGYKIKEWLVISGDVTFTKDKFTIEASDVEIKAIFDAIPYNISYENLNGASNSNQATYTIADTPLTLAPLAGGPTGHTFDGWYDNTEFGGNPITSIPAGITGDMTFYAKWTPITVTGIKLNSDNAKKVYTEGDALDVSGLTLTVGKSDGSKDTVDVTAVMVTGFDSSKLGKQTLTVSYEGFTATYEVEVKAKTNPPTPTPTPTPIPTPMPTPTPTPTISYTANDGSGNTIQSVTWQKGSGKNLDLTFKRSEDDHLTYGLFGSLEIGGVTVGSANYGASEGSLKLSIKPEYLETLSVGDHTVKANFQDGSATVKLTVLAAATQPQKQGETRTSPNTGDESNLTLWISLMFLSVAGMLVVAVAAKRRRKER